MQAENFPYKWWALIGLSLLSFTAFLDFTIVTTALPFIQKDLNASVLQLQWVMSIFSLVLCMFLIIAGKSGDLWGRKNVFYFGFILFGIAAIGAANSPTIQWLIFFRAIQGLSAAIIFPLGVALLPQAFPPHEQTRAIGIFSAFNGAGLAIGPFLGGTLISIFNWRWVFWVNIPIIIAGMACCVFSLKPSPKSVEKIQIDWWGFILLSVGLGSLIYGVIYGEQAGWNLALTRTTIFSGIILLFLLIIVENKVAYPLLDLSLFKNKHASLAILICVTAGFVTGTFMFFDPLYLQLMRNQHAFMIGVILLCVPIIQVIISLFLEKLVKKWGIFNLLVFGVGMALLAAVCHAVFTPTITILFILFTLFLMGYTWGIANAGSIVAASQSVAPERMGSTLGTIFTFWNISNSVFLALATVVFHWRESVALNSELLKTNMPLTTGQHEQLSVMLTDPQQAQTILNQFTGEKATEVLQIFKFSFMSGFHWMAWLSALTLLVFFLVGLRLRK